MLFWFRKCRNSQRMIRTSEKETVASLNKLPLAKSDTNNDKDGNNDIHGL